MDLAYGSGYPVPMGKAARKFSHDMLALWLGGCLAAFAPGGTPSAAGLRIPIAGSRDLARTSGPAADGVTVETLNGGVQLVQFAKIWRVRGAVASDEPKGSTVIDVADNRLFVATSLAELVSLLGKRLPLAKLTSPSGGIVYLAANHVTDIYPALPGLHNPGSRCVVATRDGIQQVRESLEETRAIVAAARAHP